MRALHSSRLSRRTMLSGLGGITLGLPWLERLHGVAQAQSATVAVRRVIVMTYEMGIPGGAFRPSNTGSSFTLPFVSAPLLPFRDRCLFVTSLDNDVLQVGGDSFVWGHPAKKEAALTGTLTTGAFRPGNTNQLGDVIAGATSGGANGPSVEQVIGRALRDRHAFDSVSLGVNGDAAHYAVPATTGSAFCFEGAGNPATLSCDPMAAAARIFSGVNPAGPSEEDLALRALRARNKSVLDAVREAFRDLRSGLGSADQRRLDDHAGRIRQLEIDVRVAEGCFVPSIGTTLSGARLRMDQLAAPMIDVLANAMACDLAPVGRLEFFNQQNPRFGISELDNFLDGMTSSYDWHALVHGDPLPGDSGGRRPGRGSATEYDPLLLRGFRFFFEQFAALLTALDGIAEGPESSVLDHSLVILASDFGEGLGHGHMKMNYVLAGNLGTARRGVHFDGGPSMPFEPAGPYYFAASRFCVNQLLNSVLDMAGVTDEASRLSLGLGGFLESRSRPRRIDALFL